MKYQILAMFVLAVFLLSALPVMAEGTQAQGDMPQPQQISAGDNETEPPEAAAQTERPGLVVAIQTLTQLKEKIQSRVATTEEVRTYQQEKLQAAMEDCTTAECEEKLQARVNLVERIKETALNALQRLSENKDSIIQKLREIQNSTEFGKFREQAKDFVARTVAQANKEAARLRLDQAKEKYNQARERLQDAKADFNQTREQLQACLENETDGCEQLREEIRTHSQSFLSETLDLIENQLQKVRSSAEESESLTEEEAAETLAELDGKLAEVNRLREQVAAITGDTTKEEIQNLTQQIRNMWNEETKLSLQHAAGFVQLNKMGGIYVKVRHLERRLQNVLEKMAEQEKDTTELEGLAEEFSAKLDEVESHYELARNRFREASMLRGANRNAAITEANSHMNEAKTALKEAHQTLRDIVRGFAEQGVEEELEENEAEEVLEQQEDTLAGAEE